ncbi:MAG: hypothetical protein JWR35_3144 [Marmoricola sp.]|nr:hypothetical protein [Marmoricola sp.]
MREGSGRTPTPARALAIGFYLLLICASLIQQPGLTTYDTRSELAQRPLSFLAQAFSVWNPDTNFGEIQNQAYGYLFPQGSYFALLHLAQLPDWVAQRFWSALVLIVACEGARRVGRAAGLKDHAALLVGLTFTFSPRLLGTVGVISAESLPGAVLPWAVLPILLAIRGQIGHRRAALLSAAAVVCMGGVNAVEIVAVLPLPLILLLWGVCRGRVTARLLAWWLGAVALACSWWFLPLLVLGRFSPPFYEYVESATDSTGVVGWSQALRGDSHWVAYTEAGGRAWWPAAHFLAVNPLMTIVAAVVAGVGLAGLLVMRSGLRVPLVISVVVGMSALTIAHGGWTGSPLASTMLTALDGPLQVFRNVHKVDPTVRLPLAIGFGMAASVTASWVAALRPRFGSWEPRLLLLPACVVLLLGQPMLANSMRTPGWDRIPDYWVQAASYLKAHDDGRATLVVPGSGFALESWGWSEDEPLTTLGGVAFVTRSQVPIIPGQSIRLVDGINRLVSAGMATPALADELARAGIGHVLIRRDLDQGATQSPGPGWSTASMQSAGLHEVAAFGSSAVSIYDVPVQLPKVRTTALDQTLTVAGAPESVLALQDEGLVAPQRATVLVGEKGWSAAPQVVTDQPQRRERAFGSVYDGLSQVLGRLEPFRLKRAAHDYPSAGSTSPTYATYDGLSGVTASSAQGYADNFGAVVPQSGPYGAIDADPATRWITSPATHADGQWLKLSFPARRAVRDVQVVPVVNDPALLPVDEVTVVAGDQRRTLRANPSGAALTATFDGRPVTSVEVRITRVRGASDLGSVALQDVVVDGLKPVRSLVVPTPIGPQAAFVLGTDAGTRACSPEVGTVDCDVNRIRAGEEGTGMDRTITTPAGSTTTLSGLAIARATPEAAALLEPLGKTQLVSASSTYGLDPHVSSRFAYDGDPTTAWLSADDDPNPTLVFRWSKPRHVTGISVVGTADADATPRRAVITAPGYEESAVLPGDATVTIRPVTTRYLKVTFPKNDPQSHVAVAEISLRGASVARAFDPNAPTGAICGLGPNIDIDGQLVPTSVSGTMADIVRGTPLSVQSCALAHPDRSAPVTVLAPGTHRVRTPPSAEFEVVGLSGRPPSWESASTSVRPTTVVHWAENDRTVKVAAGTPSLLAVPENFNVGWVARSNGHELTPIRVDGWQQGWLLPSSAATTIHLDFTPQTSFRWHLAVGLGLSGAVLLAGLVLLLTRRSRPLARSWPGPGSVSTPAGLAVAVLLGVFAGGVTVVGFVGGVLLCRTRLRWRALACVVPAALSGVLDVAGSSTWERSTAGLAAAVAVGILTGASLGEVRVRGGTADG